jgi:glucokinase
MHPTWVNAWRGSIRKLSRRNMQSPAILALDLGGTRVRAAMVRDGIIVRKAALATDIGGGPPAVMQQFVKLAGMLRGDEGFVAVGAASPGPLDTYAGIVKVIHTMPGWTNIALKQALTEVFQKPVILENDGIAAAVGEWKHGAGQGVDSLVYATISTGVGGGAIVDGHVVRGRQGMAGHIGHMRLVENGPTCFCGRIGCFEALASGSALALRAQALATSEPGSYLGLAARQDTITSHHVVEGAKNSDADCLSLLREEAYYLGVGFANLAHLFSPDRIIMGGGMSQNFDMLEAHMLATFQGEALSSYRDVEILPAALGDDAGLIGAAELARDALA